MAWEAGLTSGKFEHILAMDSLTSNCVSVKPLVSIKVFARRGIETENGLLCNGEDGCIRMRR